MEHRTLLLSGCKYVAIPSSDVDFLRLFVEEVIRKEASQGAMPVASLMKDGSLWPVVNIQRVSDTSSRSTGRELLLAHLLRACAVWCLLRLHTFDGRVRE